MSRERSCAPALAGVRVARLCPRDMHGETACNIMLWRNSIPRFIVCSRAAKQMTANDTEMDCAQCASRQGFRHPSDLCAGTSPLERGGEEVVCNDNVSY